MGMMKICLRNFALLCYVELIKRKKGGMIQAYIAILVITSQNISSEYNTSE